MIPNCVRTPPLLPFVSVKGLLGKSVGGEKITGSFKLSELLLSQAHVAVVPGDVFGDDGFMRLSYATSMKNISEGLSRIADFAMKAS